MTVGLYDNSGAIMRGKAFTILEVYLPIYGNEGAWFAPAEGQSQLRGP